LEWRRHEPEGAAWLEQLPQVVAAAAEQWSLQLGEPFPDAHISFVAPAVRVDGTDAVLKVNFPDGKLGSAQGEAVVLHQDFHGGNVLRAAREPWLAIDPKPLVGEREFDAASYLRDRRELLVEPGASRLVSRRLDIFEAELGLDRERVRRWGIAHALAWGVSGHPPKIEEDMIASARLLAKPPPRIRR
jgi:hypothetical protein